MLSLAQLHDHISKLTDLGDKDNIHAGIEDIFYQLIYNDHTFFTVLVDSHPYSSPISVDSQHIYLRLFSHQEIAEKAADRIPQASILKLNAIKTIQMAKAAFKSGVYGYILNEGDKWVTISLSAYLSVFLVKILDEPAMFNTQCAELLTFINELRRPNSVLYTAARDEAGAIVVRDGVLSVSYKEEGKQLTDDMTDSNDSPVSICDLFNVSASVFHLNTPRTNIETDYSLLLGALAYSGVTQESTDVDIDALKDWKIAEIDNLSVAFNPFITSSNQLPDPDLGIDTEISGEGEVNHTYLHLPLIKDFSVVSLAKVTRLFDRIKAKLPQKGTIKETSMETNPTDNSPAAPDEANISQEPTWTKKRLQLALLCGGILLLSIIIISAFVMKHIQYTKNLEQFCAAIRQQDYGNAFVMYRDGNLGSEADKYLSQEVDFLVLRYADNTLSAEELSASLRALSNFPSIKQSLLTAQVMAAKLEASKNAYVQGKEAQDTYTRLNLWRQVIDLDIVNYAAVHQHVSDNADTYIKELNEKITYYSTRARAFAVDRYEVLEFWYPDCEAVLHWAEKYAADRSTPLSFYPISISTVNIRQMTTGYWTLHIDWTNTSVKTIEEVCFSVIALDSSGKPITNSDANGTWTIFDARDIGPYAPGNGTPSSEYVWNYVFYGPMVAQVKLTAVNVAYSDGSIASFTENVDLAKLYRDF